MYLRMFSSVEAYQISMCEVKSIVEVAIFMTL